MTHDCGHLRELYLFVNDLVALSQSFCDVNDISTDVNDVSAVTVSCFIFDVTYVCDVSAFVYKGQVFCEISSWL